MSHALAVVLLFLLGVLAVTSIKALSVRMDARTWKRIQRLVYPFFLLVFVHLLGYMLVPLRAGATDLLVGFGFYVVIFAAYLVLRTRRFILDRRVGLPEYGAASAMISTSKEATQ